MSIINRWFQPANASALAIFRIGFGLILFWDMIRYGFILNIGAYYQKPQFLFYYWSLDWIQPLSSGGMQILYAILALAALGITLGAFYRTSMLVFITGFTYTFLLDEARYLNHFYMAWLFCVLLAFMPAQRLWSVDAWRKGKYNDTSTCVPAWCYWLLMFQLEVILIFAGLVKLNPDWLALEPLRTWLAYRADMPFFGQLFVQDWAVALAAYGVIALHLVGAPLLLWSRTRLIVICIYAAFHTLNHFVFSIGIFPWMTLFASLIMFGPDWPLRFWARLTRRPYQQKQNRKTSYTPNRWLASAIAIWCAIQVIVPMRHVAYPGNVAWTEEGHRFAWRMKLRSKKGDISYRMSFADGTNRRISIEPYLVNRQERRLPCQPDMIWKFAHFLEDKYSNEKNPVTAVYADSYCSLNSRPRQRIVAADTNLLAVDYDITATEWILPLTTPLASR